MTMREREGDENKRRGAGAREGGREEMIPYK